MLGTSSSSGWNACRCLASIIVSRWGSTLPCPPWTAVVGTSHHAFHPYMCIVQVHTYSRGGHGGSYRNVSNPTDDDNNKNNRASNSAHQLCAGICASWCSQPCCFRFGYVGFRRPGVKQHELLGLLRVPKWPSQYISFYVDSHIWSCSFQQSLLLFHNLWAVASLGCFIHLIHNVFTWHWF